MARIRPRMSLMTALLLTTIVGFSIVTFRLWREIEPLREEVRQLRAEVGHLNVDDPTRIYAMELPRQGHRSWRFRVYVPDATPAKPFMLHIATDGLPASGIPVQWSGAGSMLSSGEHVLDVDVVPSSDRKNKFEVVVMLGTSQLTTSMYSERYSQSSQEEDEFSWPWQTIGDTQTESAADKKVVLLRLRPQAKDVTKRDKNGKPTAWRHKEIVGETEGVMIWIDRNL